MGQQSNQSAPAQGGVQATATGDPQSTQVPTGGNTTPQAPQTNGMYSGYQAPTGAYGYAIGANRGMAPNRGAPVGGVWNPGYNPQAPPVQQPQTPTTQPASAPQTPLMTTNVGNGANLTQQQMNNAQGMQFPHQNPQAHPPQGAPGANNFMQLLQNPQVMNFVRQMMGGFRPPQGAPMGGNVPYGFAATPNPMQGIYY